MSQTNPDVSSIPEVNVSSVMVDDNSARTKSTSTNENPVIMTDKNVQARPITNDVGVSNSPQMVNAGVNTSITQPREFRSNKNVDTEEQVHSRNCIKNLYGKYELGFYWNPSHQKEKNRQAKYGLYYKRKRFLSGRSITGRNTKVYTY